MTVGQPPALMTPAELAQLLGVAPATVWEWGQRRRVPGLVRLHGRPRYRREVMEEWLRDGCPSSEEADLNQLQRDALAAVLAMGREALDLYQVALATPPGPAQVAAHEQVSSLLDRALEALREIQEEDQ